MRGVCERYDEALLLLVHGELAPREALGLRVHLAVCPSCRERRRRLEGVTRSLALALANPRLGARRFAAPGGAVWVSVGLLLVLFAVLGLFASSKVSAAGAPPAPAAIPLASAHCRAR